MTGILGGLADATTRGLQWWTGELSSLVPGRLDARQSRTPADIYVNIDNLGALQSVQMAKRGRIEALKADEDQDSKAIDVLGKLARSQSKSKICVMLPAVACLERRIEIPASARRQARSILALDLERSTPFKLSEVYVGHSFKPAEAKKGWLTASQLIVKRKVADQAIAAIEDLGLKVSSLDVWSSDGKAPVSVNFLENTSVVPATVETRRPYVLFASLAIGLVISATWIGLSRQQTALASLEQEVNIARQKAEAVRRDRTAGELAVKDVTAIQTYKSAQPSAVEIINELTRLLPDDVSANELKIDGDVVEFSGVAKSSSAVIPIVERSSMFKAALFTSPVTFDASADKERFSLRLRLRQSSRTAAVAVPEGSVQ